jgi:hypothetical protein
MVIKRLLAYLYLIACIGDYGSAMHLVSQQTEPPRSTHEFTNVTRAPKYEPVRIKYYITGCNSSTSIINKVRDTVLPRVQVAVHHYLAVNPVTTIISLGTVHNCAGFSLSLEDRSKMFSGVDAVILVTSDSSDSDTEITWGAP